MMEKRIKYIGYYDIMSTNGSIRNFSLAEARKMDYIISSLVKIGFSVSIISMAYSVLKGFGFIKSHKIQINDKIDIIYTPSLKSITKIGRAIRYYMSHIWLFIFLIRNCSRGETIIVYHNYGYAIPLLLAKKIMKLNILLEIEEIYYHVWSLSILDRWKEKMLVKQSIETALVVSEVLAETLHISNPIVSYGNYKSYKGLILPKGKNSIIRLVFTGSIDTERNGGFLSIEAMRYLPSNYHLLLSGPVAKKDKRIFDELICSTNAYLKRDAVEYLGVLNEKDYENLLLNADIALNPQKDGIFGDYVFPSKILTYLSYELPVVTTKGKSIVKSKLADILYFVNGYTPEQISKSVMSVVFHDEKDTYMYRNKLKELDYNFLSNLASIVKK